VVEGVDVDAPWCSVQVVSGAFVGVAKEDVEVVAGSVIP
jgi:hypothetical protein